MTKAEGKYSGAFAATLTGILDVFRKQKNQVQIDDSISLKGKNILITGASSGLGFEASVQLAQKGANVWMVCRSGIPKKGEEVKQRSGNPNVSMLGVDLTDLENVKALVDRIVAEKLQFDIVINNAGVVPLHSRKTKQGLEEMFVVNYLAPYYLIRSLIQEQCIRHAEPGSGRIIVVSSESHRNPKQFDWENFGVYHEYTAGKSVEHYGYSKLLLTTFTQILSQKINGTNSKTYGVYTLCPGPVNTNIAREAPAVFKPLLKAVFALFFRSPAKAVGPILYFATSKEIEEKKNDYLFLMARKDADEKATAIDNGEKLWTMSEALLKRVGILL